MQQEICSLKAAKAPKCVQRPAKIDPSFPKNTHSKQIWLQAHNIKVNRAESQTGKQAIIPKKQRETFIKCGLKGKQQKQPW